MPQETNLNVAPYFDDFDPQSNYYKVLFKPAYPVQARELNNLQSILQNQIEDMGTHFFKEGAKVIPGQLTYLPNFYGIQINSDFLGIPVDLYLNQLIGKKITGASSGVTAKVVTYITDIESERDVCTLYVDYYESNSSDNSTQTFSDNEVLLTSDNISFASTFIASGEGFARTLTENANVTGSAFALSNGVYFLRGFFVDVEDQILILDQYDNTPNYRVGLNVTETLISADVDPTLNDNARNFTNFTAPGADRLEITAFLAKKEKNDFNDQNFVQLAEVQNGRLRETNTGTDYNILADELATRTFDESGHYYVKEFVTTVKESLNNGYGNRGIYNQNQTTTSGQTPSEDLMVYKVGPGKAYVRGYPIETLGSTFLDSPKARTTRDVEGKSITFGFGPTFTVNNVSGSPTIGFDNTNTLSLRSQRIGSARTDLAGDEIGVARIYDFSLESGSYDAINKNINKWELSLYDVQTYSELTINEEIDLTTPTFIEGSSSGASGFIRYDVNTGTAATVYDVKGQFSIGERITFDGLDSTNRTITNITNYETSDVQSVYGIVGTAGTFTADLIPTDAVTIGIASITKGDGVTGVSTITNPSLSFPGIVTTGNLIQYSDSNLTLSTLLRVSSVNTNFINVVGVETVTGFIDGGVPDRNIGVTNLKVVESQTTPTSKNDNLADNESLFSIFPRKLISNVNLTESDLIIRRQFDVTVTDGSTGAVNSDTNEVFLSFDEERYSLINDAGEIEVLTSDKFTFASGNTQLTLSGIANDGDCKLITTLRKTNITPKIKTKNLAKNIVIRNSNDSGSGIGGTTLNDGLTYGTYPYGTRVQDKVISLNEPDVILIYGVFSGDGSNSDPESPSMTVGNMDGPTNTTNDLILGEEVVGSISGSRAIYVDKKSDTSVNFIYENLSRFQPNEVVNFQKSGVSAVASNVVIGSKNITSDFDFSSGQRKSIYDYSRIRRRDGAGVPNTRLRVYFISTSYNTSDTGDITVCNSYRDFDYKTEINTISGVRLTDIVDGRPRVSSFSVETTNTRSPLEFFGRTFNGGQHSSKNVLASNESITVDYNYYLPRIDRIYLDRNGVFQVKRGAPSDNPVSPKGIDGSMNIADCYVPAYTFNAKDVRITFINHKRYQMTDISKLEQRIKNLEYYTSLNQLETRTINQFIPDANGLNRFKSGIFVDNFTSLKSQNVSIGIKNSIDKKHGTLRPSHYTTSVDMVVGNTTIAGIGTTTKTNQDSRFADILGTGVKRSAQMITLDYNETEEPWLQQGFATRSESVTPFLVRFWQGNISFEPTVDTWVDVNQMTARDIMMEGSFQGVAEAIQAEITTANDGKRSGVAPVIWNSWETTGVNVSLDLNKKLHEDVNSTWRSGTESEFRELYDATPEQIDGHIQRNNGAPPGFRVEEVTTDTSIKLSGSAGVDLNQRRTGTQQTITEEIASESFGDRVVNREVIQFMRSRNITFTARSLKPFTEVYAFFDNVDVNKYCVPKLIEIEMVSGTFEVGEVVNGVMGEDYDPSTTGEDNSGSSESIDPAIVFRVASADHKYGPYDDATDTYDENPYTSPTTTAARETLPTDYTQTTTVLNVDMASLADESEVEYAGYIAEEMILKGASSGAEAKVTSRRLITDRIGTLIGSYRVPNSNDPSAPTFETGRSVLRLTSSDTNSRVPGLVTTSAEDIFFSRGDQDNTQQTTLSLRNARVSTQDATPETRTIGGDSTDSTLITSDDLNAVGTSSRLTGEYKDPLAQTFIVDDETGIYVTSLNLYFQEKPTEFDTPVTIEIREVELGTPSQTVLPFSTVEKEPDEITISDNASVATKFTFESPVYLNGQREYAIIILSNSTEYRVWISRLGDSDVSTLGAESGQVVVSTQRLLGSLFKSQNASTWTPSQYEDLTFQLYRADFVPTGSVQLFNPPLPQELEVIPNNSLVVESKTIRVGLGTTVADAGLLAGQLITQDESGATGRFVGYGGSAAPGKLNITNAGVGYTPSSGEFEYTGVAMTAITGHGINATASFFIKNGVALGATIVGGGRGYQIGDIIAPVTIGSGLGEGIKVSISTIFGNNELNITDVQGEFTTSSSTAILKYQNSSGVTTALDHTRNPISGVSLVSPVTVVNDGLHIKVSQRNHGMYSSGNIVTISNVNTNVTPTNLSVDYSSGATGSISVGTTANLVEFEGVSVASTNPGYIKIGDEIISYTGTSSNSLTGITRGIDNTNATNHSQNDTISKYEFDGVSLRRINKTHNLNEVTESNPFDVDFYKIKIDMSENGIDRTVNTGFGKAFFEKTTFGGGSNMRGTYNVPFSQFIPNFTTLTPTGTSIEPTMRTVSATSISGNEGSFLDQGFEQIALNKDNYFDSMRMVCSSINEKTFLDNLPGNKSLTVGLNMSTSDTRISPGLDLDQVAMVLTSNRVNQPITDYANDSRVNTTKDDPNNFFYVTKNVRLENPGTSIQVLLDAYLTENSDIRAFYALDQEKLEDAIFIPFPGTNNFLSNGSITNPAKSNGSTDVRTPKTNDHNPNAPLSLYRELKFSIDNLPLFSSFRIKLIGTSTNQAQPPFIKNFRALGLA